MDTTVYRKSAIERLSSPEDLDQLLRASGGGAWAALLGLCLLCGAAGVWAVKGQIPTTVVGTGMIVRSSGVIDVVARGAGTVRSIEVGVGQRVQANQLVATIGQPGLVENVRLLGEAAADLARKRERDRSLKNDEVAVKVEALARQQASVTRAIADLEAQIDLAEAQVPVMEQLYGRGLVTRQQVIAASQTLASLQGQVSEREAQIKQLQAEEFEVRSRPLTLDSEMAFQGAALDRDLARATTQLRWLENVVSPDAGEVLEIKVSPGGTVGVDVPIVSIQRDSGTLETLVYVPALHAKAIRVGMEARVSPSTAKREEYGFIEGVVTFVAQFPATTAALMRSFQNEQLVESISSTGPVTEMRVSMTRDTRAPSGFKWSSSGGPPTATSSGTLASIEIVTQRRAPITVIMPVLRDAVGL